MSDRVLIVANALVRDAYRSLPGSLGRSGPARELMVIAPLHTTRSQSLCSDVDGARREAECRLRDIAADMSAFRTPPRTALAEEDQVQSVADALAGFDADACLVIGRTPEHANHREDGVADRIHDRFRLPTVALTVDGRGQIVERRSVGASY